MKEETNTNTAAYLLYNFTLLLILQFSFSPFFSLFLLLLNQSTQTL